MEKRLSAAELRAKESQAWRDFLLGHLPTLERWVEGLVERLRPSASEAERLLALLLSEFPQIKAALEARAPASPPIEYVREVVQLAREANVPLTVGVIKVDPR